MILHKSGRSRWLGQSIDQGCPAKGGRIGVRVHRKIPFGTYELAVIPTGRGRSARSAVRAVLQGMQQGKEIEISTPPALAGNSVSRTVIAIWIYQDASMVVVHVDFQYQERYILWHAPDTHQFNFNYVEGLTRRLSTLSLEVPDQLDRILSEQ